MATQSSGMRGFGSAAAACLALAAAGSSAVRGARRRRHTELIQQQRLHFDLLCKAMDDPGLAAVLDTYDEEIPSEVQRQYLFANALYTNALLAHRVGIVSRKEMFGYLRGIFQNQICRDYWLATEHHRATLDATSDEAEIGRMVDSLLRDLDESEDGGWWIVGQPPDD
ncbi:DUF6082 family protein [Streptomyces beijiangensis]|uniref:Secreted protein n=1 Tax=Streptomyces beijiangensis TaxID=163361 RepID=A0A939F9W1_9ACTN|nr:DUF6082 family protein [Streptomyces beijiangensis]MBO0514633.1 hypothetical protein [Streptomyces beijiangensis]